MFGSLFRHAQEQVESSISKALTRVLVTLPFVAAAAFGVAALTHYLIRMYGVETALLWMTVGFTCAGALGAIAVSISNHQAAQRAERASSGTEDVDERTDEADTGPMSKPQRGPSAAEKELAMAALSSAAPLLLPIVLRQVVRHWPLVLAAASAVFVATRSNTATGGTPEHERDAAFEGPLQPAE